MNAITFHSSVSKKFDNRYKNSSLFKERYAVWISMIDKYLKSEDTVLDAGCGSGIFSFYIGQKGNQVIAIDGSAEMIALCKSKLSKYNNLNINFKTEELPLKIVTPNKYDLIISSSVLEYITDYRRCISDFNLLLKKNGILIISMPNKNSFYRKFEKFIYTVIHKPAYYKYVKNMSTVNELNTIMEASGFITLENKLYSSNTTFSRIFNFFISSENNRNSLFLGVYKK